MRRRDLLFAISGFAAEPVTAFAQQLAIPVIGFVNGQKESEFAHLVRAFRQGLGEIGYREGDNVVVEYRWAEGQDERMARLIDEMVRRQVSVLVISGSGRGPNAAKTTPPNIPVVVTTGSDPVKYGLVSSINRPGGHVTAVSVFTTTIEAKRLDLLHQFFPNARLIGALVDPTFAGADVQIEVLQSAADSRGFPIHILKASTEQDLDAAFAALHNEGASAVAVVGNPFFNGKRTLLVTLSNRYAMPSLFEARQFAEEGGLASYGPSVPEVYRQVGVYAGRILKGERAGELPVVLPTKIEFIINLKTAKALGVGIPPTLLALADEVIE
jgi:putative ABC transport system substrate-binding protein